MYGIVITLPLRSLTCLDYYRYEFMIPKPMRILAKNINIFTQCHEKVNTTFFINNLFYISDNLRCYVLLQI